MHIEEVNRFTSWCGLDGVETVVLAKGTMEGRGVLIDIVIAGSPPTTGTPTVTIEPDTCNYQDLSRGEWIATVREWLDVEGYITQWQEELARYNHVLSQVDLPHDGKSLSSEGRGLSYKLSLGWLSEAYIDVYVWVGYYPLKSILSTIIYIELVEEDVDDDGRQEYNHILIENDVYGDILPITTESLMPIVRHAVEGFTNRVRGLLDEPLVPLQPKKEESD